jgi:phosphoglycolate phosphatase-like HAD superfamily hydrolase
MGKPSVSLLVTDLDNTLWDWVEIWYRSFSALLKGIARISGIPQAQLEPEIRQIHQLRGTAEYSYLISEMPSLRKLHGPNADLKAIYRDAIEASKQERRDALRLYPTVIDTLTAVHQVGAIIAGYTESLAFQTSARVKKLGLDGLLDYLYSPPDHDFPSGVSRESLRAQPAEAYELQHTAARYTPRGLLKPSPDVLRQMVNDLRNSHDVVYVGDSLMKDVAMAQSAGVIDVWARYGVAQDREEYELLRRVTHWTDADVEREKEIANRPNVSPSFTLTTAFGELLDHFEFVQNERH